MDLIFLKSLRPLYCDYISRILCVRRAQQRRPPRPPFMYFYSRPCARGDSSLALKSSSMMPFLLAPLREGRLHPTAQSGCSAHFYSRPYARGDSQSARRICADYISTRAPTRGATQGLAEGRESGSISTRAPTRGATHHALDAGSQLAISTPAPT